MSENETAFKDKPSSSSLDDVHHDAVKVFGPNHGSIQVLHHMSHPGPGGYVLDAEKIRFGVNESTPVEYQETNTSTNNRENNDRNSEIQSNQGWFQFFNDGMDRMERIVVQKQDDMAAPMQYSLKLMKENVKLEQQVSAQKTEVKTFHNAVIRLQKENTSLRDERAALNQQLEELQDIVRHMQMEKEALETTMRTLEEDFNSLRSRIETVRRRNAELEAEKTELQNSAAKRIGDLVQQLETSQDNFRSELQTKAALQKENDAKAKTINGLLELAQEKERKAEAARAELAEARNARSLTGPAQVQFEWLQNRVQYLEATNFQIRQSVSRLQFRQIFGAPTVTGGGNQIPFNQTDVINTLHFTTEFPQLD